MPGLECWGRFDRKKTWQWLGWRAWGWESGGRHVYAVLVVEPFLRFRRRHRLAGFRARLELGRRRGWGV